MDQITVSRELLWQALRALRMCNQQDQVLDDMYTALRAALDAPVQEPDKEALQFLTDVVTAAGLLEHGRQCKALAKRISNGAFSLRKRFTAPQTQQPAPPADVPKLTDEEIFDLADPFGAFQYGDAQGDKCKDFARAIEQAVRQKASIK